jgi:hypothetical protein
LFNQGNTRVNKQIVLDPPLTKLDMLARFRIRVRSGVCTTYFDGRELSVRKLPENYDQWLAVVSRGVTRVQFETCESPASRSCRTLSKW